MRGKRKIGEYGFVRCTQCSGAAYPTKEQPDVEWLLRVHCTSCGTIKTWNLKEKPIIEEEIFGKDDVRGRNQKEIMEEIELPWWDEEPKEYIYVSPELYEELLKRKNDAGFGSVDDYAKYLLWKILRGQ